MIQILAKKPDMETLEKLTQVMVDVTEPVSVDVAIREDGQVVWINVNGICVLRACRAQRINILDDRKRNKRKDDK